MSPFPFIKVLYNNPEIILFFAIAFGYLAGKIKFFNLTLGSTAGVLLVSLVLGQLEIPVSQTLESVMFAFFMFCMGYSVGPEFFNGLKKEGFKYILLSLLVAIVGLATAFLLGKIFKFDPGTTAGLLGGAMTQSSIIGTASEALKTLPLSATTQNLYDSHIAVSYAITYIFGVAGLVVFFKLLPRLMKIDLANEARKVELEMSGGTDNDEKHPELFSWSKQIELRVYQAKNSNIFGKIPQELENLFPSAVTVEGIKRDRKILQDPFAEKIKEGDLIAISAKAGDFIQAESIIGPESDDIELINLTGEVLTICVLNKSAISKTLDELSKSHGHGCFLKSFKRAGHCLPISKNLTLKKGDELTVIGSKRDVEKLASYLGYPERPSSMTDLILVGLGCALGTLFGLLSFKIKDIPVTLGIGGGILIAGLFAGWLRSRRPTFGLIPPSAQWVFTDLGLNLFIACVGLTAGPKAFEALKESGISLFFAGAILTLTPMISGVLFGKYVLRINPVLLLGALTGAGTVTPALNAVKEEADSSIPVIGYTVPYAFANVILTIWGTVIIYLMY